MGFDKVKIKQICLMVLYVALVILVLIYSDVVFAGIGFVFSILMPFIVGGVVAFILNIPMNMIEKKWLKKWKGKSADKFKRTVSMILAMLLVIAILTLVVLAVVPQLKNTIVTLGQKAPAFLAGVIEQLEKLFADQPMLLEQLQRLESMNIDWNSITTTVGNFLKTGVSSVLTSTVNVASSIIGGITNGFISFVFAIYILSQKEKLENQGRRILKAYLPEKATNYVNEVFHRLYVNFTSFICGQCLEAVILGLMFIVAMTIFRMDYAVMIGTLIAFTALIPIVGAFIGCAVGAFMLLIENPVMALWFVVLFLVLQQIEGNLIYPRVVGNSVGLPSIWVLMAVSVGGSLMGVAGMLVFIPLMSTLYSLLRDDVNRRNAAKEPTAPAKKPRRRYHKPKKQELN